MCKGSQPNDADAARDSRLGAVWPPTPDDRGGVAADVVLALRGQRREACPTGGQGLLGQVVDEAGDVGEGPARACG